MLGWLLISEGKRGRGEDGQSYQLLNVSTDDSSHQLDCQVQFSFVSKVQSAHCEQRSSSQLFQHQQPVQSSADSSLLSFVVTYLTALYSQPAL